MHHHVGGGGPVPVEEPDGAAAVPVEGDGQQAQSGLDDDRRPASVG
ncbi:hypothetical protein ACFVW1_00585 [Streptomyces olivochromogenes]